MSVSAIKMALRQAIGLAKKREWVGLTKDEKLSLYANGKEGLILIPAREVELVMKVEAKLKEKNA